MRQPQLETRPAVNKRVVAGVLIACILLLVVGPRIKPVATALSPVYSPLEATVSRATGSVGAFFGSLAKGPTLESENQRLRREIAKLIQQEAKFPLLQRENRAFAAELGFNDLNPHLSLKRATIYGPGPPGLSATVNISVGSDDGIRVNNPVLDQNGFLIGKVLDVAPAQSTIGLLTDYLVNVPAMDAETGAMGLVQYTHGAVTLGDVESGARVRAGDFVVTSAIGNQYPIGLVIGQVTSLRGGGAQSLYSSQLRTAADLKGIQYVQVVRNFGPGAGAHYDKASGLP